MKSLGKQFQDNVLNLLFPPRCIGCRAWDCWVCSSCVEQLRFAPVGECLYCFTPFRRDVHTLICDVCLVEHEYCQIIACTSFSGLCRESVHAFKYEFIDGFSRVLSGLMRQFCEEVLFSELSTDSFQEKLVFVPVPLHADRLRWRGFNQSALLAGQLAKAFSVDCVELLTRIQPTNSQMQLTRIDRWKNVEHCFAQNPKYSFQNFEDKLIILIDDVATSGATIESCWSVLRRHGLRHVVGLVLAHGQ